MSEAPPCQAEPLVVYVIYNRSMEYPNCFICRRWVHYDDERPGVPDEQPCGISPNLEQLRAIAIPPGCVMIMPDPTDDPVILESWV